MFVLTNLSKKLGEPLLSWPLDFEDWFRQIAFSPDEFWKSKVTTPEGLRIDARMQMGRRSNTHHGQRLSMLLAEVAMTIAVEEKWDEEGLNQDKKETPKEWKTKRQQLGHRQD